MDRFSLLTCCRKGRLTTIAPRARNGERWDSPVPRAPGGQQGNGNPWVVAVTIAIMLLLEGCSAGSANSGLYVVSVHGGSPGWIASTNAAPVWSPKSDEIAWGDEDGLHIRDIEKETSRVLTTQPLAGKPSWSPDGRSIAYVDGEKFDLVVVDVKQGTERFREPISSEPLRSPPLALLSLGGPGWAPDGSQLVFTCWDGSGDEVCLIDLDGRRRSQVTNLVPSGSAKDNASSSNLPAASNVGPASWSPDGSNIAVAAYPERKGAPGGIFVIDVARGGTQRVSTLLPNTELDWSPDGKSVLTSATQQGRSDAFVVPLTADAPLNLSKDLPGGALNPVYSPDGTLIALASSESIVVLRETTAKNTFSEQPLAASSPAWSPTGDRIAFIASDNPLRSYN